MILSCARTQSVSFIQRVHCCMLLCTLHSLSFIGSSVVRTTKASLTFTDYVLDYNNFEALIGCIISFSLLLLQPVLQLLLFGLVKLRDHLRSKDKTMDCELFLLFKVRKLIYCTRTRIPPARNCILSDLSSYHPHPFIAPPYRLCPARVSTTLPDRGKKIRNNI